MAREKKLGRVTPSKSAASKTTGAKTTTTGRYTPPVPRQIKTSPPWVPVLIGTLLAVGAVVILLNYLDLLPGGASNGYLLIGLGLITAGFIAATQWH